MTPQAKDPVGIVNPNSEVLGVALSSRMVEKVRMRHGMTASFSFMFLGVDVRVNEDLATLEGWEL